MTAPRCPHCEKAIGHYAIRSGRPLLMIRPGHNVTIQKVDDRRPGMGGLTMPPPLPVVWCEKARDSFVLTRPLRVR